MYVKTITYTDYDGEERTENFYFNLNKAEIAEMDLNPLLGNPRYVTAVDARIRIEK